MSGAKWSSDKLDHRAAAGLSAVAGPSRSDAWQATDDETANWILIVRRAEKCPDRLAEAKRLLAAGVSISSAFREAGYSSVRAMRLDFVKAEAVAPLEWLKLQGFKKSMADRVREAEPLIQSGTMKLVEVAERVGFSSSQSLTEAFYRTHGMSPSAWLVSSSGSN